MLCEECGEREATCTVAVVMGEEHTTRHLCSECVIKLNAGIAAGNIHSLLSTLMSAIGGRIRSQAEKDAEAQDNENEEEDTEEDIICERCGTSLKAFRKSGHLGCPGCYTAFRSQIQPMLQQLHGRTQHAGRQPLQSAAQQQTRTRREELTRLMAQAVAAQDFETAALLRDQLRALPQAEESIPLS